MKQKLRITPLLRRSVIMVALCLSSFFISDSAFSQTEPASATAFTPVGYIIQLSTDNPSLASNYEDLLRRHIYGICWEGKTDDNLKFARQMGFNRIIVPTDIISLTNSSLSNDMYFLIQKPENLMFRSYNLNISAYLAINGGGVSLADQEKYHNYFALKDLGKPWPQNLATGWFTFGNPLKFALVPDMQQQRVINYIIDACVEKAKSWERPEKGLLFGGVAWDVPSLLGDFSADDVAINQRKNLDVGLDYWTGGDFSRIYPGTTHEHPTHSDGRAAFYISLKDSLRKKFPTRPLIYFIEPWTVYEPWLKLVEERPLNEHSKLMEDMLICTEGEDGALTKFADDPKNFQSGLVTPDWVGCSAPNEHGFDNIKTIVGKAGKQGSWFGWFGRFDGDENVITNIYQVPRWEQLARVMPSWDNLCGIPLNERSWNGTEYKSTNSCMNNHVLYSRQPETNRLFVVFMDETGIIPLKPGESVVSVSRVDSLFCENGDAGSALKITQNSISLAVTTVNAVRSNRFSVSPNPTRDYVTIKTDMNLYDNPTLKLFDSMGRLCDDKIMTCNEIRLEMALHPAGIYFLQVNNNAQKPEVTMLVKE